MAYEPLHHKYRPQRFNQLVGQDAIATTLSNALNQRRIAPAYLFCGPRGTGKTSSARILAKSLNCIHQDHPTPEPCGTCETCRSITNGSALDFIEIDAASNTGVDNIRELIGRAQFAPVQCRYKVYVIDECHMLSTAAFNALLKTLEEPPSNVVFVLATTDPQRVLPTIISRCQRFDYRRIPLEPMIDHLGKIAAQENIQINDEALRLVAQVSQGGLRDAQSLLDQLSLLEPPVTADAVWDLVGAVPERDLLTLVQAILSDDSSTVLDQARKLMDRGREPLIVLQNLAGFYRDLLIAKTAAGRQDLVAITPPTWADMQTLVQALDPALLLMGQQHLRSAEAQVKNTTQPRLWLEVTLLGLLPSTLASQGGMSPAMGMAPRPVVSPQPVAPAPDKTAAPSVPPPAPTAFTPPPAPAPLPDSSTPDHPPATHAPATHPPAAHAPAAHAPANRLTEPTPTPASDQMPPPNNGQGGTVANADLPHLWAQVIAVLEPLGTRALMLQQGSLVFFDGTVARVGISSRPLFKMAQGRVENVEAAFQKVLNRKVVVSLEVLPDPKPEPPAPNISQAPGQGVSEPPTAPYPGYPPTDAAPAPAVNLPQTTEPTASVPTSTPVAPAPTTGDSTSPVSPVAANPMASAMPTMPPLPEIASDFDRAVKNFAQFFNGQVVDIDEDLESLLGGPSPKPSKAAANQPSHPDKDVPF
jgi:DNA polymerase-3 subunit gamma/tau